MKFNIEGNDVRQIADGRRIREVYTYNTASGFVMYALTEDGRLWSRSPFAQDGNTGWDAVPPIPGSWQEIEEGQAKANKIAESLNGPYGKPDPVELYEHPEIKG